MGISYNPSIVTEGLVLGLDPQSTRSYVGSGTTWTDLTNRGNNGTLTNGPVFIPGGPFNNSGGSVQFDGTGDYLSFTKNTTTGSFTCECWFYRGADVSNYHIIFSGDNLSSFNANNVQLTVSNTGGVGWYQDASVISQTGTAVQQNAWNHIAWVRSGTSCAIFVNGSRIATGTNSNALNVTQISTYLSGGYQLNGYISNARIVDAAVYDPAQTTISVPTKPLEPIENTFLLACQGGAITDNGPNSHAITVNNDAEAITASAFEFDGTSDYAVTSSNTDFLFGTEEFAMEWWEYFTGGGGYIGHIGVFDSSNATPMIWTLSGSFASYVSGLGWRSVAMSPLSNQWAHYVVTGVTGNIRFYQNGELKDTTTWNWSATSSTSNFSIACGWGQSWQMSGKISAVRVYKGKSFTEDEVKRNFSALRGRYGI